MRAFLDELRRDLHRERFEWDGDPVSLGDAIAALAAAFAICSLAWLAILVFLAEAAG